VWLVRRLAGSFAGLVIAVAAAALVQSLGAAPFIEPWNPWLGIFAFFSCVAAAWGVLCGRHRWLWLVVFTGVFAVQCHAGYIPLVGALLATLAGLTLWRWRRDRPTGYGRSWWAAVGTLVVMWIPPLIDQWRRSPGNLRILFHHFTSTTEPDGSARNYVGLGGAVKAFVGEFSLAGPWVRGPFRQPDQAPSWAMFAITVAVLAAAAVYVWRGARPSREITLLSGLLAVLVVVGIVATSRIFGEFYDYVIRWWWILVAWIVVAVILAVVARVHHERQVGGVLLSLAVLAAVVAGVHAADTTVPGARDSASVGGVAATIEGHLDHSAHYLVRWYDPASLGGVPYGVVLELERDGFHPGVDAWGSAAALPHRVLLEQDADAILWVVAGDRAISDFRERADATELGFYDQRSAADKARSDQLRADLERRLTEIGKACMIPTLDTQYGLTPLVIGGAPVPEDVRTLAKQYDALRMPVAVFSVPVGAPDYAIYTEGCS
jgi:hypothetical protein